MSDSSKLEHPLRQVRKAIDPKYKLTQQVLANMVGCTRQTINRVEAKKVPLSEDLAERIDATLGSSLVQWVRSGASEQFFELNVSELGYRFENIRHRESKAIWKTELSYSLEVVHQVASIIGEIVDAKELKKALLISSNAFLAAIDSVDEGLKTESCFDSDPARRALVARAMLSAYATENVFSKEVEGLAELFIAARESSKFAAVQWSFVQWMERVVREFDLPSDSVTSRIRGKEVGASSAIKDLLQRKIYSYNQMAEAPGVDDVVEDLIAEGVIERMTPGKFSREADEKDVIINTGNVDMSDIIKKMLQDSVISEVSDEEWEEMKKRNRAARDEDVGSNAADSD